MKNLDWSWRYRTPAVVGYVLAVMLVGGALLLTRELREVFQSTPNALFFCAIILSSWIGGFGAGVLASVLSILTVKYCFTPPFDTLAISVSELPRFAVFLFAGLFISWISGKQRRDEAELRQARDELEEKVRARTAALLQTNEQMQTEIAERKRVESELVRLNRALRVRSACSLMVTQSGAEAGLLSCVCQAIVEVGGYRLAWIGYAQNDGAKSIRPMARAGEALEYVDKIDIGWAEDERGSGPAGRAIRTRRPVACNHISCDPIFAPWRTLADSHGLKSSVALPLITDGSPIGAVFVYAGEAEAFDEKETDMLQQTTNDLAHGIMLLRTKAERARAEDALERSQAELVRVARATTVGELTASIAHEVNQPLAAVVTNANACLRWLAGQPPNLDEARDAARRIVRDGNRASDVIARIRALLKKGESAKAPVDLNELIQEIRALAQAEVLRRKVTLQTDLAPSLPPVVADRVQLQQVLLNLITNALDALSPVTDRSRVLNIRTDAPQSGTVRVAVRDTGVGIEPEHCARLFDAFFTSKPNGLGMGLPISRSIVEAHGGKLWATPNEGPGVTFQFTLPTGNGGAA